jgi:hypothetical protein
MIQAKSYFYKEAQLLQHPFVLLKSYRHLAHLNSPKLKDEAKNNIPIKKLNI